MAQMFVANRWTGAADGRVFEVRNPATEEVLDSVPRAKAGDVDGAVAAAKRAFPEWRRTPGIERAEKLHHAARRIRGDSEGLAILLTKEGGKPLPENRDEVEWIAACLDYYAEIGRDVVGRVISPVAPLVRCRDIDEAIAMADASEYGLGASIYTNSLEHAMKAIHAGTFWINDPLTDNDAGPFGGMRRSGIGRELGSEGIEDLRDAKHVHMDYVIGAKPYWYPYRYERPRE